WEYDVIDNGYKYNTTDINSAIGLAQLKKLEWMWERRKEVAEKYDEAFKDLEEVHLYKIKPDRVSAYHLYPLRLNLEALKINRNQFIELLKEKGIGTSVHFIPLYRFTYYGENFDFNTEDFPNSEWIFKRVVSLPIYPSLSKEEQDYIIESIVSILKENRR
ncbi:MAG: UDP-4-amino-4,6-dideoxy-N-acetyl-beta-L-altrosamine transaminase, partial [Aquificae bacterium]|nr:UDP-4-amino-4,6-dideoxy-N-acetyl-beta-L-altrosamine transaminase [Aquificota bacterium]